MKQPKRLTWKQKQIVAKRGKNADEYMLNSETEDKLEIVHKRTGATEEIAK